VPRRRLGVALVLDPPLADEVDGLRRALGDRARERIAPHITLISPVNVGGGALPAVLSLLRDAAAEAPGPLAFRLGPPDSFLPANPVLHLPVSGPGREALGRMRTVLLAGPLGRPPAWPWVPHVTLADGADPGAVAVAAGVLGGFVVDTTCDRVVLLEERVAPAGEPEPRRRWVPLADAVMGRRAVIGRGGLELELTTGRVVDPEAAALLPAGADLSDRGLVCTARREGRVVGVGTARPTAADGVDLAVVVDRACVGQGVDEHLSARLRSVLAAAERPGYSKTEE
jgi:2'-5' RNA ligase